jgi:hypothetical protein
MLKTVPRPARYVQSGRVGSDGFFTICSEFSDSEFGVTCDKRLVSMNDFTNKPTAPGVYSISLAELLRHDEYGTPTAKQQPLAPGAYLLLLGWSGGGGFYTDWTFKLNVN